MSKPSALREADHSGRLTRIVFFRQEGFYREYL